MVEASCLYPDEKEIARLVLGGRAKNWKAIAQLDERRGLPPIDVLHGGRYWPAVKRFYDNFNGLTNEGPRAVARGVRIVTPPEDGPEYWDGKPYWPQRGERPPTREEKIRQAAQRTAQEGKRRRGGGDPGIYTPDIERRIEEGIRERNARDKKDD
jgi:hypothetical protein